MPNWKSALKADPTQWLLEEDNSSVRFFALRDLLDRPEGDPEAKNARRAIMLRGAAAEILVQQRDGAYLTRYPRFYTDKYDWLVLSLIALTEVGATMDEQIRAQCEYLLTNAQDERGGFSQHKAKAGGGLPSEVIPCLTGNLLFCFLRLGLEGDPRVKKGVDWLVQYMRLNDGVEKEPQGAPYGHYEMCWGKHTCLMGVVKALKALAEIPPEDRSPEVRTAIDANAEFLLIHHIFKRSHDLNKVSKPGWTKFGFPLMYQTDALEILDILTSLGIRDERMQEAVQLVLAKQQPDGRWLTENTYASERMLVPFDEKGAPGKWVTLRAMRALKRYG
jgi:hypothetical protein